MMPDVCIMSSTTFTTDVNDEIVQRPVPVAAKPLSNKRFRVTADYSPTDDGEIELISGEIIVLEVPVDNQGWAKGHLESGKKSGYFPWSYVDPKPVNSGPSCPTPGMRPADRPTPTPRPSPSVPPKPSSRPPPTAPPRR